MAATMNYVFCVVECPHKRDNYTAAGVSSRCIEVFCQLSFTAHRRMFHIAPLPPVVVVTQPSTTILQRPRCNHSPPRLFQIAATHPR
jgi:hypothetical protein